MPVSIDLNGTAAEQTITLRGPGAVSSLDPQLIRRRYPSPGVNDFEPNFFLHIDLEEADLPWRFSLHGDPERDGQNVREDQDPVDPERWRYHLTTRVPSQWTPLVPVAPADRAEHIFRRWRMRQWDIDADSQDSDPKGHLLNREATLLIDEVTNLRAGVSVFRRRQMARMPNGQVSLWLARAKPYGHRGRSSSMIWDPLNVANG